MKWLQPDDPDVRKCVNEQLGERLLVVTQADHLGPKLADHRIFILEITQHRLVDVWQLFDGSQTFLFRLPRWMVLDCRYRRVSGDHHDQFIAKPLGLLDVAAMSRMQTVERAKGHDANHSELAR